MLSSPCLECNLDLSAGFGQSTNTADSSAKSCSKFTGYFLHNSFILLTLRLYSHLTPNSKCDDVVLGNNSRYSLLCNILVIIICTSVWQNGKAGAVNEVVTLLMLKKVKAEEILKTFKQRCQFSETFQESVLWLQISLWGLSSEDLFLLTRALICFVITCNSDTTCSYQDRKPVWLPCQEPFHWSLHLFHNDCLK